MARILIVEDEPLIAMLLEDWLAEMGHEPVGPVDCVDAALQVVATAEFDAAILDLTIRARRSDPVADALRKRGIPFAFATGDTASALDGRFAGVPTVAKPYDFAAVQRITDSLTGAAQSRQEP